MNVQLRLPLANLTFHWYWRMQQVCLKVPPLRPNPSRQNSTRCSNSDIQTQLRFENWGRKSYCPRFGILWQQQSKHSNFLVRSIWISRQSFWGGGSALMPCTLDLLQWSKLPIQWYSGRDLCNESFLKISPSYIYLFQSWQVFTYIVEAHNTNAISCSQTMMVEATD